jgi:hypothetical protein
MIAEKQIQTRKINMEKLIELFKNKNYILITKENITYKTSLEFVCNKHNDIGVQNISYRNSQRTNTFCKSCLYENLNNHLRHDISFVKQQFINAGLILIDYKYINSNTPLKYICPIHNQVVQKISLSHLMNGEGCGICRYENMSGEKHWNWKGGVTGIYPHLRNHILDWKKESMKQSGFKCVITGKRFDDIHHLHGFDLILKEALNNLCINYKDLSKDYSEEELNKLTDEVNLLHEKYGAGICLISCVHTLFHNLYKCGNNTKEQFEEFKIRLKSGEFDNFLINNNLKLII